MPETLLSSSLQNERGGSHTLCLCSHCLGGNPHYCCPDSTFEGTLMEITFVASPYFVKGNVSRIKTIVLHSMDGFYDSTVKYFQNNDRGVSAHYCISKSGKITQCVLDKDIAQHAGSYNTNSIGIELEDEHKRADWVYPPEEVAALKELVKKLCTDYNIPADTDHILLHKNLDPTRRTDPVGNFDIRWVLQTSTPVPDNGGGSMVSDRDYRNEYYTTLGVNGIKAIADMISVSVPPNWADDFTQLRDLAKRTSDGVKIYKDNSTKLTAQILEANQKVSGLSASLVDVQNDRDKAKNDLLGVQNELERTKIALDKQTEAVNQLEQDLEIRDKTLTALTTELQAYKDKENQPTEGILERAIRYIVSIIKRENGR